MEFTGRPFHSAAASETKRATEGGLFCVENIINLILYNEVVKFSTDFLGFHSPTARLKHKYINTEMIRKCQKMKRLRSKHHPVFRCKIQRLYFLKHEISY